MTNLLGFMTERQKEVLGLMARGLNNTEIGDKLFLQLRTVESHINAIYSTLHLDRESRGNIRVKAVLIYQQEPQIANARIRLIDKIDRLLDEVRNEGEI